MRLGIITGSGTHALPELQGEAEDVETEWGPTRITRGTFAGTDVGRTRSGNEDSYFCGRTVFAVADGLGGHQGGEVASAAAVEPLAALDGREFADPAEAAEALAGPIAEDRKRGG